MSENNSDSSKPKLNISNRTAVIILAVLVGVAVVFLLVFRPTSDEGEPEPTPTPTETSTQTTPPPDDDDHDHGGETPTTEPTNPPHQPEDEHQHEENGGEHGVPPYVDGVEYVMTKEAVDVWHPIRAKFIKGVIGDGDIYEAIKGTATEEIEEEIKKLSPGQYKDTVPEHFDDHTVEQVYLSPYELTERITLESGARLTVTISYTTVASGKTQWLVTEFEME